VKIIGLTGGIASGKSTVSAILKRLGARIIDADEVARRVLEKGQPALRKIIHHFGTTILNEDGSLNRKKLGEIVFNDKGKLKKLNEITHPEIEKLTKKLFEMERKRGTSRIVYDCPLLIEGNLMDMVDEIWLVYVDQETQIERLMDRDGFSKEEALKRITSQLPLAEKIEYADILINNNGNMKELERKVTQLWYHGRIL